MNVIGGLSSPVFLNIPCNDIYKISAKLYKVILIAVVCFLYLLYARKLFRKNVGLVTVLISACRLVMLFISIKFCEIILNGIKVIERTRFLY